MDKCGTLLLALYKISKILMVTGGCLLSPGDQDHKCVTEKERERGGGNGLKT